MLGASVAKLRVVLAFVSCYALPGSIVFYAVVVKPTWLLSAMDGQLEAVRQDIGSVKDEIVKTKQDLAATEQAGNKEKERVLLDLLLSLNNQLLSLQEKENILLRSQAPSKPCLQLVLTGLPVFTSCCTPFGSAYPVAGHSF